jgi:ABC-type uncharacterized transport system involved in gliding motility auxiliary subunit
LEYPNAGSAGRFPLGVVLQGQFSNALEPVKEGESEVLSNPKPGKLIVIGCAKMFNDQLIMNGVGNLGLFANIVDSFTLGDNLIQIRSKSILNRNIKKLTDSQIVWYRFIAVVSIPLIWALYAYARLLFRRKEKQFYLAARGEMR